MVLTTSGVSKGESSLCMLNTFETKQDHIKRNIYGLSASFREFSCSHAHTFPFDIKIYTVWIMYWLGYFFTAVKVRQTWQTSRLSRDQCDSYDPRCDFFDYRRQFLIVWFKNKHIVSWTYPFALNGL